MLQKAPHKHQNRAQAVSGLYSPASSQLFIITIALDLQNTEGWNIYLFNSIHVYCVCIKYYNRHDGKHHIIWHLSWSNIDKMNARKGSRVWKLSPLWTNPWISYSSWQTTQGAWEGWPWKKLENRTRERYNKESQLSQYNCYFEEGLDWWNLVWKTSKRNTKSTTVYYCPIAFFSTD